GACRRRCDTRRHVRPETAGRRATPNRARRVAGHRRRPLSAAKQWQVLTPSQQVCSYSEQQSSLVAQKIYLGKGTMSRKKKNAATTTLDKGLTVLEAVERAPHLPTIQELARITGIQRLAVYRLLCTLEQRGYVIR